RTCRTRAGASAPSGCWAAARCARRSATTATATGWPTSTAEATVARGHFIGPMGPIGPRGPIGPMGPMAALSGRRFVARIGPPSPQQPGASVSIVVEDYHKVYGETVAVAGLSFSVAPGEILGLVGPNGAGKTTTLRALAGILAPTQGRLLIAGHDLA